MEYDCFHIRTLLVRFVSKSAINWFEMSPTIYPNASHENEGRFYVLIFGLNFKLRNLPDHLIREAPFIIIPGHDLNQVTIHNPGKFQIDYGRVAAFDNI